MCEEGSSTEARDGRVCVPGAEGRRRCAYQGPRDVHTKVLGIQNGQELIDMSHHVPTTLNDVFSLPLSTRA